MKKALAIFSLLFFLPAPEFSAKPCAQHGIYAEIENQQDPSLPDTDNLWIENSGENINEEHSSGPAISSDPFKAPVSTPCTSWLITVAQTVGFHTSLDQIFLRGPPQTA